MPKAGNTEIIFLSTMENVVEVFELKNKIRVVFHPVTHSEIAHCALMIGAGTRNEDKGKEGLAHFIEHMFFKGTQKKNSLQIINHLETAGGELNAFTSKEETCLHATFLLQHLERAASLIAEIAFESVFPEKEMLKEKEVILDEIRTYLDTPSEQIYDDFENILFAQSSLGNPILGTVATLNSFSRSHIQQFIKTNYSAGEMIFAVAGNFKTAQVKSIAEKYFSDFRKTAKKNNLKKLKPYQITEKTEQKSTAQCHYILGNRSYSLHQNKRMAMVLLSNILGGPGMNSRLNLAIREKYGYTYTIESGYNAYRDTGIFHIYLATEKKYLNRCRQLVYKELTRLCNKKITAAQVLQYKTQLKGQLALAQDNTNNLMLSSAKSMLHYNKPFSMKEVIHRIDRITAADLLEVANEIFDTQKFSSLLFEAAKPVN